MVAGRVLLLLAVNVDQENSWDLQKLYKGFSPLFEVRKPWSTDGYSSVLSDYRLYQSFESYESQSYYT